MNKMWQRNTFCSEIYLPQNNVESNYIRNKIKSRYSRSYVQINRQMKKNLMMQREEEMYHSMKEEEEQSSLVPWVRAQEESHGLALCLRMSEQ